MIMGKSGCMGFSKMFHSPRIAADGTSNARSRRRESESSPKARKDSSRVSCQPAGSILTSSGNLKRVRDLAFHRNQICWSQVRFQVNKGLDRSEGQRG